MDENLQSEVVRVINEHILTPVIYMVENEEQSEFICFFDTNIYITDVAETEMILSGLLAKKVMVVDIREFCEADRIEIIQNGELIYTANPVFEKMFIMSMTEDFQRNMIEKLELLKRYDFSGSAYLQ